MTELDPRVVTPEGEAGLRRARWILASCTMFWAILVGLFLAGALTPADASPDDQRGLLIGLTGGVGLTAAGAGALRPQSRSGWAVGVIATCAQLSTCVLSPVAFYLVYLLFRPQVMRACLGRAFGQSR